MNPATRECFRLLLCWRLPPAAALTLPSHTHTVPAHAVTAPAPTPAARHNRKKADEYVGHLVGHEGTGSLLSALKARGWASELSAGVSDQSSVAWLFEVSITLTEAGLEAGPGARCGGGRRVGRSAGRRAGCWRACM